MKSKHKTPKSSPTKKTLDAIEILKENAITLTRLAGKMKIPKAQCIGLIKEYDIQTVRAFGTTFIPIESAQCLIRIHNVITHAKNRHIIKNKFSFTFVNNAKCPHCGEYPIICAERCVCPNNHIFNINEIILSATKLPDPINNISSG